MFSLRGLLVGGGAALAAAATMAACAQGGVTFEEDDEGASASTSAGTGGTGGSGGSSPCAADCAAIATPQCLQSVCNTGMYQGVLGECVIVPAPQGTGCDDDTFCTVDDSCDGAGVCVGGPQNDCGMTPGACKELSCDEASQSCSEVPSMNGAACQDPTNLCLKGSTCSNGQCSGGTLDDCFFFPVPDDCHVAVCNPLNGMCEPEPGNEGQPCVDANDLCTLDKTCASGMCQGGQPKSCSHLTQGCVLGVCDTTSGNCTTQNLVNGDPCDDLDGCTVGEVCQSGNCSGGTLITQCVHSDGCCPPTCTLGNDNDCTLCGNNLLESGEESDPPPGPSTAVPLDPQTCRFDFAAINQWYCNGTCGNWGGGSGCDQGDADAFCKLKMDNPLSTATSFTLSIAGTGPGVCCPPPSYAPGSLGCVSIGVLSSRGVNINVSIHDTNLNSTHGSGQIITNLTCTDP